MSHLSYLEKLLDGVEVEWKPVGEIFDLKNGYTPSKANSAYWANGEVPWFRMEDIRTNGRVLKSAIQSVSKLAVKGKLIPANSLIMSTTATLGEHALIEVPFLTNQQITSFSFNDEYREKVDVKFMFHYFFKFGKWCAENANKNGGMGIISLGKLKQFQIPIPCPNNPEKSLAVQAEIVRVLDAFTAMTAELTAELNMRKKQYNYYRDQLLSFDLSADQAGEGEVEWKTLGDLAENLDSKRKPITSGLREAGEIPYYGASGIVDYVKDYIFDGDYLLVSEDGANLLARNTPIAFSISGKTWVNNHAHVLKFETYAERKYVEYYLNSIDLTPYISGAAQPKLNKKNLGSIKIPNPAPKEKERIVAILDKFDSLTCSIKEGLPREIELRQKQYEYYRDLLLSFPKSDEAA
ncbi:restriction endonuclease subunit S [Vibrio cincinnatiensis]|uniref:restriction endonuclease subunit S n=1 Tax=Vibrio cincinnatiensis TaxID=675 RepID=UPI001EE122B9|nr:restriction endonuclease subunit S [Vibrio cincinnatiensis]MCG3733237.1 restriction endonuclease subunit S [Vibrio cincinnatiensis]MCG3740574.1 restriction endonuclease subunit S [Vibrio cincinnatiensis]MCG3746625.1 restriction endonuclease subunit S [Vibrio cincinnatiensis]